MYIRKTKIKKEYGCNQYEYIVRIESNSDLIDYIGSNKRTGIDDASIENNKKFTHTESYEEAVDLLRYGWPDGKRAVKLALKKLSQIAQQEIDLRDHDSIKADMVGFAPHIANYIAGVPDSMMAQEPEEKPTIHIQYHCGVSFGIQGAVIRRRGAVAIALVQAIQAAGYTVELVITSGSSGNRNKSLYILYPVVQAGSIINIDKTCFMLCHPSYLRRFMFAIMERCGFLKDDYGRVFDYGSPIPVPVDICSSQITIPEADGSSHVWDSVESASRWLIDELIRQGLTVQEKTKL